MNLIDFHVTKIISEESGKMYELFGMTREELDKETDESWKRYLSCDGIRQEFEYWDDGGKRIKKEVFNLKHQKPYYVGYVGQH